MNRFTASNTDLTRGFGSKSYSHAQAQELNLIEEAIAKIKEALEWSDDKAALNDAMASLNGRVEEIEG